MFDHLDRFWESCRRLRLRSPIGRDEMRQRLVEMVAMSGIRDAYVMMIVTRGLRYIRQYAPEECENFCYLMVTPFLWVMDEETQKKGGSAIIARTVRRISPGAIVEMVNPRGAPLRAWVAALVPGDGGRGEIAPAALGMLGLSAGAMVEIRAVHSGALAPAGAG